MHSIFHTLGHVSHTIGYFLDHITEIIAIHGYIAIPLIIILQELGAPIPILNEIVLMLAGILAAEHTVSLPVIAGESYLASMLGAWILYGFFFLLGSWLFKFKFATILRVNMEKLSKKLSQNEPFYLFAGRVIPFGRGYICIAAGILEMNIKRFATTILISDFIWNIGWVLVGYFGGARILAKQSEIKYFLVAGVLLFVIVILSNSIKNSIKKRKNVVTL